MVQIQHPTRRNVQSLRPPLLRNRPLPLALQSRFFLDSEPRARPGEEEQARPLALLEAVLLVADEPLSPKRLAQVVGLAGATEVRLLVNELQNLYDRTGSAFAVEELAGGYQLLTREEFHPWVLRFRQTAHPVRLSAASQETLAIVAYRQPIMRAEVEGVRGVQCGEILRQLMEKGYLRIVKRDESLGRPVLYGTTKKFLQVFGLKSLADLPMAENLVPPKASLENEEPRADDALNNEERRTENRE